MGNTAAVKLQKLQAKTKYREALVGNFIDRVLDQYNENPNKALQMCHEAFGRTRFTSALKNEICRHTLKLAYVFAINRCVSDGQPFPVQKGTNEANNKVNLQAR